MRCLYDRIVDGSRQAGGRADWLADGWTDWWTGKARVNKSRRMTTMDEQRTDITIHYIKSIVFETPQVFDFLEVDSDAVLATPQLI